ncbi:4-aminobutyrate--2-oxoglutarate transaminase [Anaerovorax odorimutans]|uniref:(S)-3-amino-2-methylpropionate transaminase n=1 Tax=Anaerovorax odorimutans TaxID=109327 RepID=A0ABT1RTQ8_9FIRM|nr:4-aminobutyrate--2-oxoglutarate transaminase [Anaerovorax odorimutans]MCQ4638593.1 4-aminobutyrate--2-oxoglutarate transaminase [Anaerovorax odorimutans]
MSLRTSLPKIVTDTVPGPKSTELLKVRKDNVTDAVAMLAPVFVEKAEGAMVQDVDGNVFLDFVAGIGVLNIGHSHPEVVEAVKAQADKYFAPNLNVFNYEQYPRLAEKLNEIIPIEGEKKTILVNTGAEADENAVKLARRYTGRSEIICFAGAFHGRSYMTMAMTSKCHPYKTGFGPLPQGVNRFPFPYCYRCPYGLEKESCGMHCAKMFEESFFLEYVAPDETAAIILEPVLGEGGFIIPPDEFLQELRRLCDKYGILLIADEIQAGYARTGKMFACEHWSVRPDIVVSAKSVAGGIPVACVTAKKEIMEAVSPGELGGTYCGNALATASALKVLEIMERDDYCAKARHIGDVTMKRFLEMKEKYQIIGDVRGVGAMLVLEFVQDRGTKEPAKTETKAIINECMRNGLVVLGAGVRDNCIRFLMPLVITDEQIAAGLDILEKAIAKIDAER